MSSQERVAAALAQLHTLQHAHTGHVEHTRKTLKSRSRQAGVAMRVARKGIDSGEDGAHEDEYTTAALEKARAEYLLGMLDDLSPASTNDDSPRWSGSNTPPWSSRA